ncbi:MAG: hypothetical protein EAZ99_12310 [Alphaproteobacteria bacterium]|nr:MAG: hypothetical protein EAZ99_12310 [Alphaproteobacteria bacterium]
MEPQSWQTIPSAPFSADLAAAVLEALPAAVALVSEHNRLLAWNRAFAQRFQSLSRSALGAGVGLDDLFAQALAVGLYAPTAVAALEVLIDDRGSGIPIIVADTAGMRWRHQWRPLPPSHPVGRGCHLLVIDEFSAVHDTDRGRPGVDPETELADRDALLRELQRRIDRDETAALLLVRLPETGGGALLSSGAVALVEVCGTDGLIARLRGSELGVLLPASGEAELAEWRRRVAEAIANCSIARVAAGLVPREGSAIDALRTIARALETGRAR